MSEYWRDFLRGLIPRHDDVFIPVMAWVGLITIFTALVVAVVVWFRFVVWTIDRLTWWAA